MEKQQPIKGRTISTDPLYKSIESANCLLTHDITTVGKLQKGRQGVPSGFPIQKIEIEIKIEILKKIKKISNLRHIQ